MRTLFGTLCLLVAAGSAVARAQTGTIDCQAGQTDDGRPTALWLDAIQQLKGDAAAAAAATPRPLTVGEIAWEESICSRKTAWQERREALAAPYRPADPPLTIRILTGNRGGEDAFAPDARTIAFDLSRLVAEYGDARSEVNALRIDRLFAHEYSHLMQQAWLALHPQPQATAMERAELAIWREGLGNYESLSERWRSRAGEFSPAAREALDRLVPVYVARLAGLACVTAGVEAERIAGLSQGAFDRKWGALPAALWLEIDVARRPEALREFVQSGTAGVRELARRHLTPSQFAELEAARAKSAACAPG